MKTGIILIIAGIIIPLVMFLFWGDRYVPQAGLIYNMKNSKLVFKEGYKSSKKNKTGLPTQEILEDWASEDEDIKEDKGKYEEPDEYTFEFSEEKSIPFKYVSGVGLLVVLLGVGLVIKEI